MAIETHSKVETGGYSSIHDIRQKSDIHFSDKMETFYLAETLKYLYLLFAPVDTLPLDKFVFNTEAHPLPIFVPPQSMIARSKAATATADAEEKVPDLPKAVLEAAVAEGVAAMGSEDLFKEPEAVAAPETEAAVVAEADSILAVDEGAEELAVDDIAGLESDFLPEVEVEYDDEEGSAEASAEELD